MSTLKVNSHAAAALKADRERDKIQAMRDHEAETLARQANMMRLRALRLAKENHDSGGSSESGAWPATDIILSIGHNSGLAAVDARRWTQILAKYRKPNQ